ncbi:MAG: GNAT family N-acetyltransferase [Pseudomonadaceae bacterium]|nr:GNAT family N-acetyltransferase [Pseudomonadaceae bacterium]
MLECELTRLNRDDWAHPIAELLADAYRVEARLIGAVDFPPMHRTAADVRRSESSFFGLLDADDKLHAVIETEVTADTVQIASLGVSPESFRLGLASRLVKSVVMEAGRRELSVVVTTAAANKPALSLYRRFGFKVQTMRRSPEGIDLVDLGCRKRG